MKDDVVVTCGSRVRVVVFEVDVLYILPIAVVYGSYAWRDLIELSLFVGVLFLAIVYAWRKGVLQWR